MPISGQNVPRSRWDYGIPSDEARTIPMKMPKVAIRRAKEIDTHGMVVLGTLSVTAIQALETTIRRAVESEATEARFALA